MQGHPKLLVGVGWDTQGLERRGIGGLDQIRSGLGVGADAEFAAPGQLQIVVLGRSCPP